MDKKELRELLEARLDERGREFLNPIPIAPPVGFIKQPSLTEQIRDMVRSEALRLAAESGGMESFEEADDFDVGELDPSSPYEEHFEPVPAAELRRRAKAASQEQIDKEAADQAATVTEAAKPPKSGEPPASTP